MKCKLLFAMLFFALSIAQATTVMEDAQDGTIEGWRVRTGPANGISNVFDAERNSRVIQFRGGGSYLLGATHGENALNIVGDTTISWKMRTTRPYTFFVIAETTNGLRYIFYTFSPNRGLLHGFEDGIHHGLGAATIDGRWRTFTRDLDRDLKDAEPENEIIAINGLMFNGGDGAMIDDVILYTPSEEVYEDGEDHSTIRWHVSDNTPQGAQIRNIEDNDRQGRRLQGRVISLQGDGVRNAYRLGDVSGSNAWNNRQYKILQWRFRDFGLEPEVIDPRGIIRDPRAFEFRVFVQTEQGRRHLLYTLGAEHRGLIGGGTTIHHGLGDDRIRGSVWAGDDPMNDLGLWQTITRDLEEDIRDFEPDNRLVAVDGFEVRNSGLVDDIKMLSSAEDALDGDNIDGWSIYANNSGEATITRVESPQRGGEVIRLQGEGLSDGYLFRISENVNIDTELTWSMNYNEAFSVFISVETTNGRRYLTYTPRDNDRGLRGNYLVFGIGADANNGTWQTFTRNLNEDLSSVEPSNELIRVNSFMIRGSGEVDDIEISIPQNQRVLEDAEDGKIDNWRVYVNTSNRACISNKISNQRGSRVISLKGEGKSDGYRFDIGEEARVNSRLTWSMNYNEAFAVFISVETTNGRRYLTYSSRDDNRGLSGEYVLFGIGADASNGTWQTFTRNLNADLRSAEPENRLIQINSFMIRGSGEIDDIILQ